MAGNGGNGSEMKVHEATYHKVISMLKWGSVACFFIAAVVVWLISR